MNTNSINLNLPLALLCAKLSADAYTQAPSIYCRITDTQVLIRETDTRVIVAFRGTSNLRDFLTDADAWKTYLNLRCPELGKVHRGFLAAHLSIYANLLLHPLITQNAKQLVFTGHSLGGSLAVLAAYIVGNCQNTEAVFTFGQPRVGNRTFAGLCDNQFGSKHFRFINKFDLIPRLAPWHWGYRHSGQELMLTDGGLVENPILFSKLILDAYQAWQLRRLGPAAIPAAIGALLEDHHINHYIAGIDALNAVAAQNNGRIPNS